MTSEVVPRRVEQPKSTRWVLAGAALADSLVVNPHKWLFTPIDISALYFRDPAGNSLEIATPSIWQITAG